MKQSWKFGEENLSLVGADESFLPATDFQQNSLGQNCIWSISSSVCCTKFLLYIHMDLGHSLHQTEMHSSAHTFIVAEVFVICSSEGQNSYHALIWLDTPCRMVKLLYRIQHCARCFFSNDKTKTSVESLLGSFKHLPSIIYCSPKKSISVKSSAADG